MSSSIDASTDSPDDPYPYNKRAVRIPGKNETVAIDPVRLAKAIRARISHEKRPEKRAPEFRAMTRDPCPKCGIPGSRGCDHQLPYDG